MLESLYEWRGCTANAIMSQSANTLVVESFVLCSLRCDKLAEIIISHFTHSSTNNFLIFTSSCCLILANHD